MGTEIPFLLGAAFLNQTTRGTAATLLRENGFTRDVVERLLAHQERSSVVAAYTHAEYADERRKALQWLADRIDTITT